VAAHGATNRASDSVTYGNYAVTGRDASQHAGQDTGPPASESPCFRNRNRPRGDCRHLRLEDFSVVLSVGTRLRSNRTLVALHNPCRAADCRAARRLALGHVKAHYAALAGLAAALLTAIFAFHMPARLAGATAVYGAGYGLFPIGWIVLSVIFMYQLTVESGQFNILQHSLTGITQDRRLQLLLHRLLLWSIL